MITEAGLLSVKDVSKPQLLSLYNDVSKSKLSRSWDAVGMMAFFEPSTRTRVSFERAGLFLGIRWIHLESQNLSLQKGESFRDTFQTLALNRPDFFVVRHSTAGFAALVSQWTNSPVFNAGDRKSVV